MQRKYVIRGVSPYMYVICVSSDLGYLVKVRHAYPVTSIQAPTRSKLVFFSGNNITVRSKKYGNIFFCKSI